MSEPKEEAKSYSWIIDCIEELKKKRDALNQQRNSNAGKKKKGGRKQLENRITVLNQHIVNLETIQRGTEIGLLNNEVIKEKLSVKVYFLVKDNSNDDLLDMYDSIDLKELESKINRISETQCDISSIPDLNKLSKATERNLKDVIFSFNELNKEEKQTTPSQPELPKWFPTKPIDVNLQSPKVDDEFLMFLFYNCQDSEIQMQAAEMLKQRKWVFHKGFKKWFKRINNPMNNSKYSEIGDFQCYDYEQWCFTTKTHFTFYYNFLDD